MTQVSLVTGDQLEALEASTTAALAALEADVPYTIWVPAPLYSPTTGSPTLAKQASRWSTWQFDAALIETVSGSVAIPSFWETMNVDLWWSNMGAGVGDVRWFVSLDRAGDGDAMGVSVGGGSAAVVVTAPAQDVLKVSRVMTDWVVDATKLISLKPSRTGTDAADTLANDASLVGILLSRVVV